MEMILAPLGQTLKATSQALECGGGLWLQRPRLMDVVREDDSDAGTLVRITPLDVQIYADGRERPSSAFTQGAAFFGLLHGSFLVCCFRHAWDITGSVPAMWQRYFAFPTSQSRLHVLSACPH